MTAIFKMFFEMHFSEWKCMNLDQNNTHITTHIVANLIDSFYTIAGSTLNAAVGLVSVMQRRNIFRQTVCKGAKKSFDT